MRLTDSDFSDDINKRMMTTVTIMQKIIHYQLHSSNLNNLKFWRKSAKKEELFLDMYVLIYVVRNFCGFVTHVAYVC